MALKNLIHIMSKPSHWLEPLLFPCNFKLFLLLEVTSGYSQVLIYYSRVLPPTWVGGTAVPPVPTPPGPCSDVGVRT
ncbi:hypothetical protein F2Q69_00020215 [Brassica cretica]|uniref:Uncharacterized protein n=1 Tax=Brassica cretica TaxID=69181 RepID=A0A8S9QP29_BRACR|nr:hypothetical protein F2Q69_00020215 [Brassica cretica]